MVAGGDREREGAELVRRVAVGGDAIRAGERRLHLARRHQRGRRAVRDHLVRNAVASQLPRRQAHPLQPRPRLVDEHAGQRPGAMRLDQHAEGRAAAPGRQRPGVAVRQRGGARGDQRRPVPRHRGVRRALLLVDVSRLIERCVPQCARPALHGREPPQHAIERPAQVHRRRSCRAERRGGRAHRVEVGRQPRGQRETVGGGDADGRRAAHAHRRDRLGDGLHAVQIDVALLGGQQRLIEQPHAAAAGSGPRDGLIRGGGGGVGAHAGMVASGRSGRRAWRACRLVSRR